MSSDLLAEFDSFYKAPSNGQPSPSNPPTNNVSFFGSSNSRGQKWQGGNQTQGTQWNNTPAKASDDIWGDMSSFATPTNPPSQTAPQNDIWDSFKTVPVQGKMPAPSQTFNASRPGLAQSRGMNFGSTKPAVERRPTLDLFSNNIIQGTPGTPATTVATTKPPVTKKSSVGEVLFDADEEQDDDEFGDFEDATAPSDAGLQPIDLLFGATTLEPKPFNRPSDLLMSPNAVLNPLPYPQAPKSPSFQERNPFAELGLATTPTTATTKDEKRKSVSPVTAWPTYEPKPPKPAPVQGSSVPTNDLDDDWGDFADLPPETPAAKTPKDTPSIEADSWGWDWADKTLGSAPQPQKSAPPRAVKPAPSSTPKAAIPPKISTPLPASAPAPASVPVSVPVPKKNKPPPTNIPPPSVLLTLFPPLFNLPQSVLFQPVADQPFSLRNRILSDPGTVKFLRAYLLIATVAARIIAGRKLRWKRDSHLSQAMKIGPAGGKSGMKLTGVDKAEATRESREATEVVRVWKEQLGRLRSAVAAANSSNHDILSHMVIPEIGEVMHINTLKGAMTDVKACLLCGLKREERIAKVDIDELIEDSFGEWWIGYWGHRDCRNFWEEHESKLKHH